MKQSDLRRDWERNRVSVKSLFIILFFRASVWAAQRTNPAAKLLGLPVRILYKFVVEIVMGIELPDRVVAGPGLAVFHGVGLVVNARTILGSNVTLRQNTTIGSKIDGGLPPRIGDGVSVGANCVILGDIEVGDHSIIGAGTVLTRDCPARSVVHGPKAQIREPG
ncbi:serine acetyltransferase [Pseudotabrizicola alkalilacus]|uniref:Serine acetyltransferase n=1 Tax=Pseudotabrizicola alkalilacus TaxID=2305252 RepID=A0A411Z6R7_9RHOB|nr:serine acetyltransferase [Pseudotabrizicola alkalilacus]RGP38771.1 serine acetyltransferase [Pseudotabrizicola alkalilacus]